jgi:predicted alpha/beta-fold hydrolase
VSWSDDRRPFKPAWWLPGGHAQTLAGKLLRPRLEIPLERERLETPDGDFLDIEWTEDPGPGAPLCIVLHGLEGNAKRPYAMLLYQALARHGIRAIGLHFRSCSGEPNRLPRMYHSGETGDLGWLTDRILSRYPSRSLSGAGFSLGGNVLLKHLGELGDSGSTRFKVAATLSVPFDLSAGADALERSWIARNVYTRYFIRSLRGKASAKAKLLADAIDLEALDQARSLREFDDLATAPLHGFRDAEDYYAKSSSNGFLASIRVETLLLHSLDDPFLPVRALPVVEVAGNRHLRAAFTPRGGHVGFVEGALPWRPRFWAEQEMADFIASRIRIAESPTNESIPPTRNPTEKLR